MRTLILENLNEAQVVLEDFISQPENIDAIEKAAALMADAIQNGGKIISCGNGGSMTDAMHFAEELSGKYREQRPALPAISISDPSFPGMWKPWDNRATYSWQSAPAVTP